MTDTDTRTGYIAGLRKLADRLERNPDCPLPYYGRPGGQSISIFVHDDAELREAARAIGGTKEPSEITGFRLVRRFAGLEVAVAPTYGACERVQVGTKTVEREEVVEPAKTRTVTVEEPVYETRCPDVILADSDPPNPWAQAVLDHPQVKADERARAGGGGVDGDKG